jgi:hypothetical protein
MPGGFSVDLYPVAALGAAGWGIAATIAKLMNRPTVMGRIIGLVEKGIDTRRQIDLEREKRTTEIALEQERRITEVAREQEKRTTEVALESERRTTQVMLEEERRKTEVARNQERRARLTAVASAVPAGGVLTDQSSEGSSTIMRNHGLDLESSSPGDLSVAGLGD